MNLSLTPRIRASLPAAKAASVRRSKRNQARFAILAGGLFLVLAQLGLGVAVETRKPEWRDPEYGHRIKQVRETHPRIIAIGSSRTLMGLSPKDTGLPLYNFGQTGAGPLQILLTVRRILDEGVRPDAFLIELFPAALVGNGPADEMIESWGPRWSHADISRLEPYADNPARLEGTWLQHRIAPWYSLRFPIMNHIRADWLPASKRLDFQWHNMDRYGWLPYPFEQVSDADQARLTEKAGESYRRQLTNYAIGEMSDRALRDVIRSCREAGIPVAFYLMPEGPSFAKFYSPGSLNVFRNYAAKLTAETGVPVFDSSTGFADLEFADSHHLLPSGASRFSRRLAEEHLRRWLSR